MQKKYKKSGLKGSALIIVYLIIVLLVTLTAAIFSGTVAEKARTESERNNLLAFYIAEAGAGSAINWLKSQASPPTGAINEFTLVYSDRINFMEDEKRPARGFADIRVYAHKDNLLRQFKRFIIFSLGTAVDNAEQAVASRQAIIEIQEESFAKYSYFTDDEHQLVWQTPVWFTTGSFLEGPVHTNSHYHISGDPVFDGPVSSHDNFIDYMHGGPPADNPEFRQGIELGVDSVNTSWLNAERVENAAAQPGGLLLEGDTTVKLLPDGTMDVTNANNGWSEENMLIPSNQALFVDNGDLIISGTLMGKMTAGASNNIVIADNITYKTDPVADPSSTDMMGLVSKGDVVVSSSAPFDLSIYATIAATGTTAGAEGSFVVENYWQAPAKGTLTIYGGLIQIRRGPVGTFNPNTNRKVSGYDKDYHYDPRCRYNPPSWYPRSGYDMLSSSQM
jgi:hypothetical protein